MNITHEHSPSVETERELNKAARLLLKLKGKLPEQWMREQADLVLTALDNTRHHFRDYMMQVSDDMATLEVNRDEALVRASN